MARAKTAAEVQLDVIRLLEGSDLAKAINGTIYKSGYRAVDSEAEDIVVTHTAGVPDQHQTGIITINIFVQDIPAQLGAVLSKAKNPKADTIEVLAQEWADSISDLSPEYEFELRETIETVKSQEREEHFIAIILNYELLIY